MPNLEKEKSARGFSSSQARFVYRNAVGILAVIVLLTLAAFPLAKSLKIRANFMDLLPAHTASITDLQSLNSYVGGASYLIGVIESPDEQTARAAAGKFAKKIQTFPAIGSVDHRTSFPAFENRKLLFVTLESLRNLKRNVQEVIDYNRRKNNPFFIDLEEEEAPAFDVDALELEEKVARIGGFSSKGDGTYMEAVLIKPNSPLSDFERSEILFEELKSAFHEIKNQSGPDTPPLTMELTGPYKVRYDEYRTILADLRRTGTLSVIFIGIIMLAGLRSFRSIFYIYVPLGIVILWTCAFAFLSIGYLNLISGFLFGILLGMGIDYAIHLRITLEHHFKETGHLRMAIEKAYAEVGKPILTSALTASIAFYSMAISSFEGFRHFGIISGTGILLSFIVVFYGVPSLMTVVEKFFPEKPSLKKTALPLKIETSQTAIKIILVFCIAFSLYSAAQIFNIKFDYNFANLQARDEGIKLAERVYKHFGVELTPAAFITPNRERAEELVAELKQYMQAHPETSLDFAASVMSHVPREQEEKIAALAEIDALIEQRKALIPGLPKEMRDQISNLRKQLHPTVLKVEDLPGGLTHQYEGGDRRISVVFVFPKGSILDGQVAKRFIKELRSLEIAKDIKLAGEPVIYADILMLLEQDTPRSLALSFFMVVVVLFFHFKKPQYVFWVLQPVMTAFLWMVGMAGAANFKFNYLNVAVLPSVLGAGIDNGVYIYHAYKNRGQQNILDALRNTGKGVLLASATAIAAFASLLFADHQGMASMGKLGVFGFTSCFLTSVVFLPALVQFFEGRKNRAQELRAPEEVSSKRSSSLYKT